MNAVGVVVAAAQVGLDAILVKPRRGIGTFKAHVTLREHHTDEMEITQHPVDVGASVADHAFKRPARVTIECAWSNSPPSSNVLQNITNALQSTVAGVQSILTGNSPNQVRDVYQKLLALQASAVPFDVFTGKRNYTSMLIQRLDVDTDEDKENILSVRADLQQVLIAKAVTVAIAAPAENQKAPEQTTPSVDRGERQLAPGTNYNATP